MKNWRGKLLYTISDLARALGSPPNTVWAKVYRYETMTPPRVRQGKNKWYSEKEYLRIIEENKKQ